MFYAKCLIENISQLRKKSRAKNAFKVAVHFKQYHSDYLTVICSCIKLASILVCVFYLKRPTISQL